MKKLIILSILLLSTIGLSAQCNLPYKPLSEFNKDTTAFIVYNFMDRKDCYKGQTLKEVTRDLSVSIKDYVDSRIMRGSHFGGITIYIYDDITVSRLRDSNKDYNAIYIYWETPININDSDFKKFRNYPDWDKGAYNYVKDMKIKEIGVVIPMNSKYYEKYKEKETKSHDPNKRKEGDW